MLGETGVKNLFLLKKLGEVAIKKSLFILVWRVIALYKNIQPNIQYTVCVGWVWHEKLFFTENARLRWFKKSSFNLIY